jgi:diaminopimelate epimerase
VDGLAAPLVGGRGEALSVQARRFWKMSGSGNDFVVFDRRAAPEPALAEPAFVRRVCARGTGVGADGVIVLERSDGADVRLTYMNADGSPAFCGNATLCAARLSVDLGAGRQDGLTIETEAGVVRARLRDGRPEVELRPVTTVRDRMELPLEPGEERLGYAVVGVPHLVVLCAAAGAVDLPRRGRALRLDPSLPGGANVNFVSREGSCWAMRTFERGVEGETLACGSGAVSVAILLAAWGLAGDQTALGTRSGLELRVSLQRDADRWLPSLSGEGRIVFEGALAEL